MDNEITLLRKEIERQNIIINLLIEKNRELERKFQLLFPKVTSQEQAVFSNELNGMISNNAYQSLLPDAEQLKETICNDSRELQQSNHMAYSNVEEGQQPNHLTYSKVEEGLQLNQSANAPLLPTIDIKKVDHGKLYWSLRRKMPHAPGTAAKHAASIMIHLYSKKENTHHELSAVTGLSARGMAKHVMMLKRRGYIVRTAYQQYELTVQALNILREAMG